MRAQKASRPCLSRAARLAALSGGVGLGERLAVGLTAGRTGGDLAGGADCDLLGVGGEPGGAGVEADGSGPAGAGGAAVARGGAAVGAADRAGGVRGRAAGTEG